MPTDAGTVHRCTKYCRTEHQFGNVYRCLNTGCFHICDITCDQHYPAGQNLSVCAVSGKHIFTMEDRKLEFPVDNKKRLGVDVLLEGFSKRRNFDAD